MNQAVASKLRKGIAIALKQFPWLRKYDKVSGIYRWSRCDENENYCWYVGKAKNLLRRTAQHIVDCQSHLDRSIKKHGFIGGKEEVYGWDLCIVETCNENELDEKEQEEIEALRKIADKFGYKLYNIESGGTTGKTIIGEKKQRRDVKWKTEARAKVLAEYREYFDLEPKDNAFKKNGYNELKAEPKKLKGEYYGGY